MGPDSSALKASSIGVVISVYNRPRLVIEALESVAAQSSTPSRVVIVDDGSTDDTVEVVERWLRETEGTAGWSLVASSHRGASAAKNTGLAEIDECEWVVFLDSDDLWPTDFLARAEAEIRSGERLVGVSSDRKMVFCDEQASRLDDLSNMNHDPLQWLLLNDAGIGSCSVLKVRSVRDAGGFPIAEPTGHDIVLFTRLFAAGPWAHMPGDPVSFRRNHTKQYGEQDHIFRSVKHASARWAELLELSFAELASRGRVSSEVRRAMARRWIWVAKEYQREGCFQKGRECLKRSRKHRPLSVKNLKLRIRFAINRGAVS